MQLEAASVFYRVVMEGSFSGAARRLGLPTSSVSRQVASLENELGVRLLTRTTRSLRLTDAGRGLYEHLQRVFTELEEAEAQVREMQQSPRGHLRITMPVEFGMKFMGKLVAEFMLQHPQVTLEAELSGRLVNLVEERFDLALRIGEFRDSSLIARRLGTITRRWFASPDYLVRCGYPQSPEDLEQHECILFLQPGQNTVRLYRPGARGECVRTVRGRLCVNNLSMAVDAAVAGLGLVLTNPFICDEEVRSGSLVPVLPDYAAMDGGLFAMYPSRQHMPSALRAFAEFVASRLCEHPWFRDDAEDKKKPGQAGRELSEQNLAKTPHSP
jgi:DNA-binding transcriptional LysR family regulator